MLTTKIIYFQEVNKWIFFTDMQKEQVDGL